MRVLLVCFVLFLIISDHVSESFIFSRRRRRRRVNGVWCAWGACSNYDTLSNGIQYYSLRSCNCPTPANGGAGCSGTNRQNCGYCATACTTGQYFSGTCSQTTNRVCASCPQGYYCPDTQNIYSCQTHQYQDGVGQTACKSVPTGYYGTPIGSGVFTGASVCDAGYYCVNSLRYECGLAKYQGGLGSTGCFDKGAGYYGIGGSSATTRTGRAECGVGYYCPANVDGRTQVTTGYYSTGSTSTTRDSQYICEAGNRCVNGDKFACVNSGKSFTQSGDSYQDQQGQTSCKSCIVCQTGFYQSTPCTATSQGQCTVCTVCPKGQTTKTECANDQNTVCVVINAVPVITLKGSASMTINAGSVFTEPGYTATDSEDGDITANVQISGWDGLNTLVVGSKTRKYSVTDSSGSSTSQWREVIIVDNVPPVIVLYGASPQTVEGGGVFCDSSQLHVCPRSYADPGYNVTDNVDSWVDLVPSVVVSGSVNIMKVGSYSLTYSVKDKSGNSAVPVTRSVLVQDTTPPVVTLFGSSTVSVILGTSYSDSGATAVDTVDGTVSVTMNGTVNIQVAGTYYLSFTAVDNSKNKAVPVVRTVVVLDLNRPSLTLIGPSLVIVEAGSVYSDQGAYANDTVDSSSYLNSKISATGLPINTFLIGTYYITYSVVDSTNVSAIPITRTIIVRDSTPPTINITGPNPLTLEAGKAFTPPQVTLYDLISNQTVLQASLKIDPVVNPLVPGIGSVTYTAQDGSGNSASAKLVVKFVDTTAPVLTLLGQVNLTIEGGGRYCTVNKTSVCPNPFVDPGFVATDAVDGNLTTGEVVVTGTVSYYTPSSQPYVITYIAKDQAGNVAPTQYRYVYVMDRTPPVITLLGSQIIILDKGSTFQDPGVIVVDEVDTLSLGYVKYVSSNGSVNTSAPGSYYIGYNAMDAAGNKAISVTRGVIVNQEQRPVLTLIGNATIYVEAGTVYQDLGVIATDYQDDQTILNNLIRTTGLPINTLVLGVQRITYDVTDTSGLSAITIVRTIIVRDTVPPMMTLIGASPFLLEVNTNYVDPGVTYNDTATNATVLASRLLVQNSVVSTSLGNYSVVYTLSDLSNNIVTLTRYVIVRDSTPPVLALLGNASLIVEAGGLLCSGSTVSVCRDPYVDAGATASDNFDSKDVLLTRIQVSGAVDIMKPSATPYLLNFSLSDTSGNKATPQTRSVLVRDITPPVITLVGSATVSIAKGASYNDAGAIVVDTLDTLAGKNVSLVVSNPVDPSTPGVYTVTYNAKDVAGNAAAQVVRTVIVGEDQRPVLFLNGAPLIVVEAGDKYADPGCNVTDIQESWQVLYPKIVVHGLPINTTALGTYTISYDVVDSTGLNASTVYRTVVVHDTTAPVVTLVGPVNVSSEAGQVYTDQGVTLYDRISSQSYLRSKLTTVDTVNYRVPGLYKITYSTTDESGNQAAPVTRNVSIVDTTAPVLSLIGSDFLTIEGGGRFCTSLNVSVCPNPFVDPGAVATDNVENSTAISRRIDVIGTVQVLSPSSTPYILTYTVTDTSGNQAVPIKRSVTVVDTRPPVITLVGEYNVTVRANDPLYKDSGAIAVDEVDTLARGYVNVTVSGSVNLTRQGNYLLTYNAQDAAGNKATPVTRNVYVTDLDIPIITLNGAALVIVEGGSNYVDLGATAYDAVDLNLTSKIVTTGLPVNTSAVGQYTITYNVKDGTNQSAVPIIRTVVVQDTTDPVITITGANPMTVQATNNGSNFNDLGATASDLITPTSYLMSQMTVVNNVNIKVPGNYSVTYSTVDQSNNKMTAVRVVIVVDTTPPTLVLVGSTPMFVEAGGVFCSGSQTVVCPKPFVDPGAVATDNVDDQTILTANIAATSNVNNLKIGFFTIVYSVSDSSRNKNTLNRTVIMQDTKPPVITLLGANPVYVEGSSSFTDPGAIAVDELDTLALAPATVQVVVTTNLNVSVPGNYSVFYDAADAAGNKATTVVRTVLVGDSTKPVLKLNGPALVIVEAGSPYSDQGAIANDTVDSYQTLTPRIKVTGLPINTSVVGVYTIQYDVTDLSGLAADPIYRSVVVQDTTDPVITLNGQNPTTIQAGSNYTDAGATATDIVTPTAYLMSQMTVVSTVNSMVPGNYTVTYSTVDQSNNKAIPVVRVVIVVDTTAPVLTLKGANPYVVEAGGVFCPGSQSVICPNPFVDPGAIAFDVVDGPSISSKIVATSNVNTLKTGSYVIFYNVTDAAGNSAVTNRSVKVQDTKPPVITLLGDNPFFVEGSTNFTDPGAIAVDELDTLALAPATVQVVVTTNLNVSKVGNYSVFYDAADAAGNKATTVVRTVLVGDSTKPVLKLNGPAFVIIEAGSPYSDQGVSVNDTLDPSDVLNSRIKVTGLPINTSVVGVYTIQYDVTDLSGLAADPVFRSVEVHDTTDPVITLNGQNPTTIQAGSNYTDAGATATDIVTPTAYLMSQMTVVSTINSMVPGTYSVIYSTVDQSNNKASATRTVTVVDSTPPVITLLGANPYVVEAGGVFCSGSQSVVCPRAFVDPGATATDNVDAFDTITSKVQVTNPVNLLAVDNYTMTYFVSDSSGNKAAPVNRAVVVQDTTPPVLTLLGQATVFLEGGTPYVDAGALAVDELDTLALTPINITVTNPVNIFATGTYTVQYDAHDAAGNKAKSITRTVIVNDVTQPTITLLGEQVVLLEAGTVYGAAQDAGASATDKVDGNLTANIVVTGLPVNTLQVGLHFVYYNVHDSSMVNASTVKRTIVVQDTTAPNITILGANPTSIEAGSLYNDSGASYWDLVTNSSYLIQHQVIVNQVDTTRLGTYTVSYSTTDASGNKAGPVYRTVTVFDNTPPTINITGDNPMTVEAGSFFNDPGATAYDYIDGDLTYNIQRYSTVNTSAPGTFYVNYTVSDIRSGKTNYASAIRQVLVVDTTPPVLSFLPQVNASLLIVEGGFPFTDPGVKAVDLVASASLLAANTKVVTTVNVSVVGNYSTTYFVTDEANNTASLTRTVMVRDTTPPAIQLIGNATVTLEGGSTYMDPGFVVSDNVDTAAQLIPRVQSVNNINNTVLGVYTVTYFVSDLSGNPSPVVIRNVIVVDTTPPVMTLLGPNPYPIEATAGLGFFVDPGVSIRDIVDQPDPNCDPASPACILRLQGLLVVTGVPVSALTPNNYTVTYNVRDLSGNAATPLTRILMVRDTTPPAMSLVGPSFVNFTVCPFPTTPTQCTSYQYESLALLATRNRVCSNLTTCPSNEKEAIPPTPTSDRVCIDNNLPITTTTMAPRPGDCSSDEYYEKNSKACVPYSPSCLPNYYESKTPTPTSDRACALWDPCRLFGYTFIDPGALAVDIVDGNLTNKVAVGTFNIRSVSLQNLTYSVSDKAGNKNSIVRSMRVHCANGTYSDGTYTQSSKCSPCPPGFKCPFGDKELCSSSIPSALGEYQPSSGQTSCLSCPKFSSNANVGSKTIADCLCGSGFSFDSASGTCKDVQPPVFTLCPTQPVIFNATEGLPYHVISPSDASLLTVDVSDNCLSYDYNTGIRLSTPQDFNESPCISVYDVSGLANITSFPIGNYIVNLTARDAGGNMVDPDKLCSFKMNVVDNQPPKVMGCPPASSTLTINSDLPYVVMPFAIRFWDNDNVHVSSSSFPSLSMCAKDPVLGGILCSCDNGNTCSADPNCRVFPGQHSFTFVASDDATPANQQVCSFTYNVVDVSAPVAACPSDIFVQAPPPTLPQLLPGVQPAPCNSIFEYNREDGTCSNLNELYNDGQGISVVWPQILHRDNVAISSVTSDVQSGSYFLLSPQPVAITNIVTDSAHSVSSCSFNVYVCPYNYYGLGCNGVCNCSPGQTCNPKTGECSVTDSRPTTCSDPLYGEARVNITLTLAGLRADYFNYQSNRDFLASGIASKIDLDSRDFLLSFNQSEGVENLTSIAQVKASILFSAVGSDYAALQNQSSSAFAAFVALFNVPGLSIDLAVPSDCLGSTTQCNVLATVNFVVDAGSLTTLTNELTALNVTSVRNSIIVTLQSVSSQILSSRNVDYVHTVELCSVVNRADGRALQAKLNAIAAPNCALRVGGNLLDALAAAPNGKDFLSAAMAPTTANLDLSPCFVPEYSNALDQCVTCECGVQPCNGTQCMSLLTARIEFAGMDYDSTFGNPVNGIKLQEAINAVKQYLVNMTIPANTTYGVHLFKLVQLSQRRSLTDATAVVYSSDKNTIDRVKALVNGGKFVVNVPGYGNATGTPVAAPSTSSSSSSKTSYIVPIVVVAIVAVILLAVVAYLIKRRKKRSVPFGTAPPSPGETISFNNPMFPAGEMPLPEGREREEDALNNPLYSPTHPLDEGSYSEVDNRYYSEPISRDTFGVDEEDFPLESHRGSEA